MLRRETGRDDLPSANIKVFNPICYGLSDFETVRPDH